MVSAPEPLEQCWAEDQCLQVSRATGSEPTPSLPHTMCLQSSLRSVVTPRRKLGVWSSVHAQGHPKLEQSAPQDTPSQSSCTLLVPIPREGVPCPRKYRYLKEEGGLLQNDLCNTKIVRKL